jgi:putative DNA methylase
VREPFAEPNVSFSEKVSAAELLADFDAHYERIKSAERDLYSTPDRHLESDEIKIKESNLHHAIEAFLDKMPRVFDPFAGGGAIPLEASRLGCRAFGNDINPVAHIIQKGSLEFPQKYGKPIVYSRKEFVKRYGEDELKRVQSENSLYNTDQIKIENRLSFDVEFYARELLKRAEAEIGHFYPADEKGKKPIAYYWARVGTCSNPSCRAEIPLLKGFYLANTTNKQIYLKPIIEGNKISFAIGKGKFEAESWMDKSALKCPICGSITNAENIRQQVGYGKISERLLAVIYLDANNEKAYRLPALEELDALKYIPKLDAPHEKLPNTKRLTGGFIVAWGYSEWGQMFSSRQLLAMLTLVQKLNELKQEIHIETDYGKAVASFLGILVDRVAQQQTSFGLYKPNRETLASPFGRQAIPMVFDYPESNLFSKSSGSAYNQLDWILLYLKGESWVEFSAICKNASSGEKEQFAEKSITAVVTDPPYYDAIAYADLSDFFYAWLKRTLSDVFPANFATPQTPKSDECTALKYHHKGNVKKAKQHFENKLLQIFDAIEHQTSDVVSIMFAHQSTEAWTTLCNSILGAKMNITGSWAIDTEMANRSVGLAGASLESSVTVSCKPANRSGFGDYQTVKRAIENCVEKEVDELYGLGFRGADLLTACFGKAVGEFGKYERVEKASGDEVTVAELLEMTRESAFNALLKGFEGDDFTKFYIGWLELYGFTESDFDDAAKFTRIGLSINIADLFAHDIFIKNGNKQTLAKYDERNIKKKNLGEAADASLIDKVHKTMWLYDPKTGNRNALLEFIGKVESSHDNSSFWRVLTSLKELTIGTEDYKQVSGLLENKENLISDSREKYEAEEQQKLFN